MKRFYLTLVIGIIVGSILSVLFITRTLETLELKTLDHRFHTFSDRITPSKDIVIITIDQNSIDYLKYKMGIVWKWPRDIYAYVIDYLRAAGAKAILLDFIFSDPDIDRAEFESGETDIMLGEAIKKAGNVTNSIEFFKESEKSDYIEFINYDSITRFAIEVKGIDHLELDDYGDADPPIPPILEHSASLGSSNVIADPDGIVRKVRLFHKFKKRVYTHSSFALFYSLAGKPRTSVDSDYALELDNRKISLNRNGEVYINWYGPGGPEGNTFTYYPIANVLLSYLRQKDGAKPKIPPEIFRDKIVLIGSNTPLLFDLKPTPFSVEKSYPGVEIVATIINNLLDGSTMSRADTSIIIILIFISALATSLVVTFIRSVSRNVITTLILMVLLYIISILAFNRNIFLDIVPIEASIALSFMSVTVFNYLTEGKEKRWLRKAFSQYLSPTVIEEITKNPDKLTLGGEKRDVSVLFSDIRGFTSMSEKLEPELITNILNEYFTPMSDIVLLHDGTLDKYIGDAIMAFFGAPVPNEDHPQKACRAALDMIESLQALKKTWQSSALPEFVQNINIGIGINSGPVVVGNMGSESRFDYTIIGDNVNLSSRLEGANKFYGTNILISENTYNKIKNDFVCRELDFIQVAGKAIPIRIYELIKVRDGSGKDKDILQIIAMFQEGLRNYREQRWEDAIGLFTELHEKSPDEKVYNVFINRCNMLKNRALPDDWNGVFERREK